jgi:hypothetical protein
MRVGCPDRAKTHTQVTEISQKFSQLVPDLLEKRERGRKEMRRGRGRIGKKGRIEGKEIRGKEVEEGERGAEKKTKAERRRKGGADIWAPLFRSSLRL